MDICTGYILHLHEVSRPTTMLILVKSGKQINAVLLSLEMIPNMLLELTGVTCLVRPCVNRFSVEFNWFHMHFSIIVLIRLSKVLDIFGN